MQVHPHCQYKTYIWEFPVRLSHWINVLSIIVLALTGLFIGSPRLTHHITMWLILCFIINHIYSAWMLDIKEHDGEMSSIFSGFKYITRKEK